MSYNIKSTVKSDTKITNILCHKWLNVSVDVLRYITAVRLICKHLRQYLDQEKSPQKSYGKKMK